jgi:hypothetical protein
MAALLVCKGKKDNSESSRGNKGKIKNSVLMNENGIGLMYIGSPIFKE